MGILTDFLVKVEITDPKSGKKIRKERKKTFAVPPEVGKDILLIAHNARDNTVAFFVTITHMELKDYGKLHSINAIEASRPPPCGSWKTVIEAIEMDPAWNR